MKGLSGFAKSRSFSRREVLLSALIGFVLGYFAGAISDHESPEPTPDVQQDQAAEDSPIEIETKAIEPVRATLPFSFEEQDLRITVVDVAPPERYHGVLEGYRQLAVRFRFENLLQRDWENSGRGCVGIPHFKLKTDSGNVYNPRYSGGSRICGNLRPQSVIERSESYIFEIHQDEIAAELWGYSRQSQKLDTPTLIFDLSR